MDVAREHVALGLVAEDSDGAELAGAAETARRVQTHGRRGMVDKEIQRVGDRCDGHRGIPGLLARCCCPR
ncbi:MAG: hypothetical protein DHS20C21_06730 [Gemmatimonadota bacterium]|nr:MAG: hypothetical protein DHS20C21_06730 [Gemmatimonadota bacterium]